MFFSLFCCLLKRHRLHLVPTEWKICGDTLKELLSPNSTNAPMCHLVGWDDLMFKRVDLKLWQQQLKLFPNNLQTCGLLQERVLEGQKPHFLPENFLDFFFHHISLRILTKLQLEPIDRCGLAEGRQWTLPLNIEHLLPLLLLLW